MRFLIFVFTFSLVQTHFAQTPARPKLVVGIVVDQMRYDYLYRFNSKYGKDGFNRLLQGGAVCENTHIPYIPTYTAPGHTCVYTGSVPAMHGIVGNDWFVKSMGRNIYCTSDTSYETVGGSGRVGQQSPKNLWVTTVTDELRLAQNFKNKTIAVAIKDRSCVLPGGHSANAAYWFDGKSGHWISSTYYQKTLPTWVSDFNNKKLYEQYLKEPWTTKLDIREYDESDEDDKWYERSFSNEEKPVFPHKINETNKKNYEIIKSSPWGNTYTAEMAKAALIGEQLGKSNYTDFLAISFSSTDYIGHQFGPNSIEIQDAYLRLDTEIASLLQAFDAQVGKGNYVVFLTADHAAAHARGFMDEHHFPSEVFYHDSLRKSLNSELATRFGKEYAIAEFINMQLYFNETLSSAEVSKKANIQAFIKQWFLKNDMVSKVVNLETLNAETLPSGERVLLENGYHPKRSGDMQVVFKSAILEEFPKGTTHGTGYNYDSHIPLVFYGWGINKKRIIEPTYMTDIAPTIATLLHIQEPSGSVGKAIKAVIKD